jgi:HlyD family secretion protein
MTRRNQIGLGVILAVVAALVAWALRPQPVSVEIAEVTKGGFEQAVSDDGQTRVRDRYLIAAPLAGQVERIQLEVGDPVKQAQIVAELTPTATGKSSSRSRAFSRRRRSSSRSSRCAPRSARWKRRASPSRRRRTTLPRRARRSLGIREAGRRRNGRSLRRWPA